MIKNGADPSSIVILKDYWPTTDRSTIEGEAYKNLHNAFGVANIRAIYRADYGTGQPQTTSIYLPNNDDDTCKKWRYGIFTRTAKQPEPRVRMLVVMSSRGKSLLDCDLGEYDPKGTKAAHDVIDYVLDATQYLHRLLSGIIPYMHPIKFPVTHESSR